MVTRLEALPGELAAGTNLIVFPEGTRSRDGRLREFKKGGFMMALDLELPILPVSITGSRHVLRRCCYRRPVDTGQIPPQKDVPVRASDHKSCSE